MTLSAKPELEIPESGQRKNDSKGDMAMANINFILTALLSSIITLDKGEAKNEHLSRMKRGGLLFPPGSGMGLFLALALPVDLPQYELSLSYNFEANYLLPDNLTELELGPQIVQARSARSLTRTRVYDLIENRLNGEGMSGKSCLLRTICETSATPLEGHNGLLGDLLHVFFTPSASEAEGLPPDFIQAEEVGRHGGKQACHCNYQDCPVDLFELFSQWSDD